jgi:hypothetical protein
MIPIRARWRPILLVGSRGRPLNVMVDEVQLQQSSAMSDSQGGCPHAGGCVMRRISIGLYEIPQNFLRTVRYNIRCVLAP